MEPINIVIPFATLLIGMLVADVWLSPRMGKRVVRAVLTMPETQSIQRALKHLENFMEALDEFGKSDEMKKLAQDIGQMYQRISVMFLPKEQRDEPEYG